MAASVQGYTNFLRSIVGVPVSALPDDSPFIQLTYNLALSFVPCTLAALDCSLYELAVYNCATSWLLNYTPDQPGSTWFADKRNEFGLLAPFNGILNSASDQGTSASAVVPDFVKTMTLQELQWMKDPFGRAFLGIMQMFGSNWVMV